MSVKIYVGNISFETTSNDLRDLFSTIGSIESCTIVEDHLTGRSRGFGFVTMSSKAEAENAIAQLDGKELDGRDLQVNEAKPKQTSMIEEAPRSTKDHIASFAMRTYFKTNQDAFGW